MIKMEQFLRNTQPWNSWDKITRWTQIYFIKKIMIGTLIVLLELLLEFTVENGQIDLKWPEDPCPLQTVVRIDCWILLLCFQHLQYQL